MQVRRIYPAFAKLLKPFGRSPTRKNTMKMTRRKSRLTNKVSGLPASLPLPEPLPSQPPPSQLPATPLAHLTSLCLPVRQGLGRGEASKTIQASYRGLHARRRVEKLKKQITSGETAGGPR